jgi:hypothetical protein
MRVTTHLESASCAIGNSAKEPPMKMRANTPHPMPRLVMPCAQVVQPWHHLWGKHSPSWSNFGSLRESSRRSNSS